MRQSALVRLASPAAIALLVLSGCATGTYNDQFSCPKTANEGSPCMSALQAYKASDGGMPAPVAPEPADAARGNGAVPPSPRGQTEPVGRHDSAAARPSGASAPDAHHPRATPLARRAAPAGAGLLLRADDLPKPIRTPAQVMRIYIAPWVGSGGDLTMPTYVFTEIEPRRWSIGEPVPGAATPHLFPLQVQHGAHGSSPQPSRSSSH